MIVRPSVLAVLRMCITCVQTRPLGLPTRFRTEVKMYDSYQRKLEENRSLRLRLGGSSLRSSCYLFYVFYPLMHIAHTWIGWTLRWSSNGRARALFQKWACAHYSSPRSSTFLGAPLLQSPLYFAAQKSWDEGFITVLFNPFLLFLVRSGD